MESLSLGLLFLAWVCSKLGAPREGKLTPKSLQHSWVLSTSYDFRGHCRDEFPPDESILQPSLLKYQSGLVQTCTCSCFLWITWNYVGKTSMKIFIIIGLFHSLLAQVIITVRKPVGIVVQLSVHFLIHVNTLQEVVWQTLLWLIESWIRLIY